jgi:hypothetical protein
VPLPLDQLAPLGGEEVCPGLWRWETHHPGWGKQVASYAFARGRRLVLVDPLAAGAGTRREPRFWRTLAVLAAAASRIDVLVTVFWHRRSVAELVRRHPAATVWSQASAQQLRVPEVHDPTATRRGWPPRVRAIPTARGDELVLWLEPERALLAGDVLLGGVRKPLRICPQGWLPKDVARPALASSLEPLLELPVERVLVSHGASILTDARGVLERALRDA